MLIQFHPGPKLIALEFEGQPVDGKDVTDRAAMFLFCRVELKGATLQDFYELVRLNPVLQTVWHRDFISDFLEEASKGPLEDENDTSDPESKIEYLSLSNSWELDTHSQEYEIQVRPSLLGVGVVRTKDWEHYKAGERTHWGLLGSKLRHLLALEVRFDPQIRITEADTCKKRYGHELSKGVCKHLTLGSALDGVFWELSFHGSPADAQAVHDELVGQMDDIKEMESNGEKPRTYTMEEVFSDLYACEFAAAFESATVSAYTILEFLKGLDDDVDAVSALEAQFGKDGFRLKPGYQNLTAVEFRRRIKEQQEVDQ